MAEAAASTTRGALGRRLWGDDGRRRRGVILAAVVVLLVAPLALGPAVPARAESLGGGVYRIYATEFGADNDPNAPPGSTTSSGHVLQENDRLVALPACTESSCPWLGFDAAANNSQWGPNTGCAEDDGLCWVQIVSLDTGACAVAPVLDVGPLFRRDNWWQPESKRNYDLPQGEPAAEAVIQGADVGFGPGITDAGYDISSYNYGYGPGMDIAAGTWQDLGLPPDENVTQVEVTLLWQTGITHDEACGGGNAVGGETNAIVTADVNLRDAPGLGGNIVDVLPAGSRVTVTGGPQNGYYPLDYEGERGWASGDALAFDAGSGSQVAIATNRLNLRSGPSVADDVLDVIPSGSTVTLTGNSTDGFAEVSYQGTDGWAYAAYLSGADIATAGSTAVTTDDVNLRAGPSSGDDVLQVIPAGATLGLTGDGANGYLSVSYAGTEGWVAAASLAAATSDRLNLRAGPSSGDDVLLVMPAGSRVALTGQASNGYVSVSYNGEDGWAAVDYLSGGT